MKMRHISMAKRVCIILPFYLFTFLPSFAQTFTQRLQKQTKGGGIVTLHQDKAIDELVNGPKAIAVPRPTTVKPAIKKDISHIKAPTVTPVARRSAHGRKTTTERHARHSGSPHPDNRRLDTCQAQTHLSYYRLPRTGVRWRQLPSRPPTG